MAFPINYTQIIALKYYTAPLIMRKMYVFVCVLFVCGSAVPVVNTAICSFLRYWLFHHCDPIFFSDLYGYTGLFALLLHLLLHSPAALGDLQQLLEYRSIFKSITLTL